MYLLFKYPFPLHSCSLMVVSDSWAVPLGSVCALDLSLDFSRASVPLCDFPYGLHIRLGCHRVLPSACLFSGSLGFTPKCGWVFFSKGICTFFSLLCSYSSYICRQSFPERGFSNPFSTAESEPSGFSNFGFILFLWLTNFIIQTTLNYTISHYRNQEQKQIWGKIIIVLMIILKK